MIEVLERYIEFVTTIVLVAVAATITVVLVSQCATPIVELTDDKSMVPSTGVQEWEEHTLYGRDLLLMLINLDLMSPYPKAIRINDTPVLRIDNSFIMYKMRNVATIYASSGQYKLSTMLDWEITNIDYVYSGEGAPYIQYTLEDVA